MSRPVLSPPALRLLDLLSWLPGPIGHVAHIYTRPAREPAAQAAFTAVLERLGPGDICLDLGANVGLFTTRMAATGATVHAFEPDPLAFATLQPKVADLPNVVLHNAAVGAADGTATLARPKDFESDPLFKTTGSSIARTDPRKMDATGVTVPVIGLFGFLQALPARAALIKMDIEGAEWAILDEIARGRGLDRFDHLFVETHERFDPWRLMPRLRRLMAFAERTEHPRIDLYWH